MSNSPSAGAEEFLPRIITFFVGVLTLGTPFVRWIVKIMREARIREVKEWMRTDDGRDCMGSIPQETMESERRYMYDYLQEWDKKDRGGIK